MITRFGAFAARRFDAACAAKLPDAVPRATRPGGCANALDRIGRRPVGLDRLAPLTPEP
jgi:hypothetical protein